MKLLSATVRNYRLHREVSVSLEDAMVMIHGPNESGKSTLAEAIHCALFLKAKGNTSLHKAMEPSHGGTPEVEILFEAGGCTHRLRKTFSSSGTTVLETEGEATLNGSNAEESLAQLLGVDGPVSGGGVENKMMNRWAHLWVWQGKSSQSPLDTLSETQNQLREKLQAQGGQSILSSPLDNAVIESLRTWHDANYTSTGRPKTGSDLERAVSSLQDAEKRAEHAHTALNALEQAASDFRQAEEDIKRHETNLKKGKAQLNEIREKLKTVATLREQLNEKRRRLDDAQKTLDERQDADSEIRELEHDLKAAREKASPLEKKIADLRSDSKEKKAQAEQAREDRQCAQRELERLRSIADALQSHRDSLIAAKRIKELGIDLKSLKEREEERKEILKRLVPLENFTEGAVKELASAEREAEQARLRLEAYALEVEVLEADAGQTITLDDAPLLPDEPKTLSRSAELRLGSNTRIRLTPGGAADLEAAREESEKASEALKKALQTLGVSSVEEARDKQRHRDNLVKDREALDQRLSEARPGQLEQDLEAAEKELIQLRQRRDATVPEGANLTFHDDRERVESALAEARTSMEAAQWDFSAKETKENASRQAAQQATASLEEAETDFREHSDNLKNLQSRLDYLLEKSGSVDVRGKAIVQAEAERDRALAEEETTSKQLDELGADQLELDEQRLSNAVATDERELQKATGIRIRASTQLASNGSTDPEREVKEAQAEAGRTKERHRALSHQAAVRKNLFERLTNARKEVTDALTRPLEEAVTPYLQNLFRGSRPHLRWSADSARLEGFELDRTREQQGLFRFDQLSHGTREQAALALRLALAQVLAVDHDGSLPLVLDDAFTNADRERIEKLKSLLFKATQNGLQIILLTCHPENYAGLGASEFHLRPVSPGTPSASPPPSAQTGDPGTPPPAAAEPPATPASANPQPSAAGAASVFLDALQALGGRAGNTRLRQHLGWDETAYETTKAQLLASGQITPGKGRGGSVALA